jgi:hypothetical protein
MIYADAKKGEIVGGFKCIGRIKNGLWAAFKPDNSSEWTEQQRLEWRHENQRRQQQKAKEWENLAKNALAVTARDTAIRKLHNHFGLSGQHREDLRKRGLTDSQIDHQLYFSVTPNQEVPFGIPANLPGVRDGQITAASPGYACITFDPKGRATGWQIRLDDAVDNKYRWAKGEASSHLENGELPITSIYPSEIKHPGIWAGEGILKPAIAAHRLGIVAIGAASANFAASPQQTEEHLRAASERLGGTKEVIFAPDGGAIGNPHVLKAYRRSWELFIQFGYDVKVAWWGQFLKTDKDIDELIDYSQVEYITPEEFLAKAKIEPIVKRHAATQAFTYDPELVILENQKYLDFDTQCIKANPLDLEAWMRRVGILRCTADTYKDLGREDEFHKFLNQAMAACEDALKAVKSVHKGLGNRDGKWCLKQRDFIFDQLKSLSSVGHTSPSDFSKLFDAAPKQEQVQPQQEPAWKQRAKAEWRKNRRFTNAVKSCTKWVDWEKPPANSIFFGKAGLGRGKTTRLMGWTKEWKLEDLSFLCFGYRNSLLLQLCSSKKDEQGKQKGLGFYHLHEHSGMMMKSASGEGLALCVDSLWRFSPEDFDDKIIILDEVQSVVKHLLHSSTVRNRDKIIGLFHEAIKRSRQVICLDGLMADWCVDYLHGICPEKQIIKAENTYQGKKPVVNYLLGTVIEGEEKGKIKVNDRSPWFKHLMENSCIPVVCSDSQGLIEALDNIFTEKGLKVLRIDSKTVPELYIKECLEDCNAYIKKHRPDVLLYTPSAESGVDVSIPDYFTEHFAFFFGVLDIDAMLQMLGRIRDSITKYVWCKSFVSGDEKQHSKSPFATAIQESLNQLILGDISTSISDSEAWSQKVIQHLTAVVTQSNNIDTRVSTLIQSIQNFEKSNLRECLKEALLESGYTIRDCILESSNHGKKAKDETEAVNRHNASDIFKAEKIPIETLKELSFDAKWEDRCKVMQARLRERLPGIDQTDVWNEDFVYLTKYGDRDFISHQEMFWLFKNPEIAKQQSQKHFHWMARRLNTFIGNYKSRWAKLNALYQIGLPEFLDSGDEWTDDSPQLVALVERARQHTNALGCHPGSQTNIRFLGKLLAMLG